jgi:uncharacterized damage-inducible protein DinB
MSELNRIADQLRRAWQGEAWHGPSLQEALRDVSANQASQKHVANAHSIWQLVLHLTTWTNVARRRFEGELVNVVEAEDWPAVAETSDAAWQTALTTLEKANQDLLAALETAAKSSNADARLDLIVQGKDHNVYVLLHGTVQHHLYHTGQIVILKRALA